MIGDRLRHFRVYASGSPACKPGMHSVPATPPHPSAAIPPATIFSAASRHSLLTARSPRLRPFVKPAHFRTFLLQKCPSLSRTLQIPSTIKPAVSSRHMQLCFSLPSSLCFVYSMSANACVHWSRPPSGPPSTPQHAYSLRRFSPSVACSRLVASGTKLVQGQQSMRCKSLDVIFNAMSISVGVEFYITFLPFLFWIDQVGILLWCLHNTLGLEAAA